MGWTGGHVIATFLNFKKSNAGWPSGQRCKLASVESRVRSQPKSKHIFGGIKSLKQYTVCHFELN